MEVKSPLTGSNDISLIDKIPVQSVNAIYDKILSSIDSKRVLGDLDFISLYRCNESGYEFYWPLNIAGDDQYYAELGLLDWYYLPEKWEHNVSLDHINKGDKVLEVGAAKGDFIKRIQKEKGAEVVGLELNSKAEEYAKMNQVTILNQSVQDHAKAHSNTYDVVCTYQVLEHIGDVKSFIQAMVDCLKPGGKLIISVPNNASFIGTNRLDSRVLNMPPHHMGRWTSTSLRNLTNYFAISFHSEDLEPIQEIHHETYVVNKFYDWLKIPFLVKVCWKLKITRLFKSYILRNKEQIDGHSINVYFTKN